MINRKNYQILIIQNNVCIDIFKKCDVLPDTNTLLFIFQKANFFSIHLDSDNENAKLLYSGIMEKSFIASSACNCKFLILREFLIPGSRC